MHVQWVSLVRYRSFQDTFVVKPTHYLYVEILYNEYTFSAAFAVSSLLAFLAIITLILKLG
jgi:ABC-type sulfate transport system permease subunit